MPLIEWDDRFSVGLPAVDHEHRELIGLINETHARIGRPGAELTVPDFLGEIYARISAHFALEETIMRRRKYDEFATHKADHERLLDDIRDIMDTFDYGAVYDETAFAERLRRWFMEHFKTHDARLHRYLR